MDIVREGRAALDYMESNGWFVKFRGGRAEHEPLIDSEDIENRCERIRQLMRRLPLTLAVGGADTLAPNALWLEIRPDQEDYCGVWELRKPFAIPSDQRARTSGDRDAWAALAVIMQIAPDGNFPQPCSAPLPHNAGPCGKWFAKITPQQHACSQRCRQRKREATPEYRARKAKYAKKHRSDVADRVRKGLELVKGRGSYGKKR